jgi:uncharacterized protein (DUF4415 family)
MENSMNFNGCMVALSALISTGVGERTVKQQEGVTAMQAARRGRPKAAVTKEPVKLRLDADVLAALRSSGDGWQTRINDMLRASLHLAGRV